MTTECLDCHDRCYDEFECPECSGTGIFVGAGVESVAEAHFYNLARPVRLPCRVCGGHGFVIGNICQIYG